MQSNLAVYTGGEDAESPDKLMPDATELGTLSSTFDGNSADIGVEEDVTSSYDKDLYLTELSRYFMDMLLHKRLSQSVFLVGVAVFIFSAAVYVVRCKKRAQTIKLHYICYNEMQGRTRILNMYG